MSVTISGSRYIKDNEDNYKIVSDYLKQFKNKIEFVNVGDCRGLDQIVINWCSENNIEYKVYKANWNIYGKGAGPIRNKIMIDNSNFFVGFPVVNSGKLNSKGTIQALNYAKDKDLECFIYEFEL
uniref:DNA recombination-mediator protein A n=1 Tax=Pithovirus LCDPAC02 TaxID=2506601 RepID=A0A481YNM6_9VIRU|nr:MAG: DNA recombination-mediator protein A [Pithovirus LCDPAC02]